MHVNDNFSDERIAELAMSGVKKISLRGKHGATLCSLDETVAMAAFIVRLEPLINPPPMLTIDPEGETTDD